MSAELPMPFFFNMLGRWGMPAWEMPLHSLGEEGGELYCQGDGILGHTKVGVAEGMFGRGGVTSRVYHRLGH